MLTRPGTESWPPPEAFWVPEDTDQENDGSVRCTGIAICDQDGGLLHAAHQGQAVHFLFEFAVAGEVGAPSGWLELRDGSGTLIHGRGAFHDGPMVRVPHGGEARLRYRYVVNLDLAPGKYSLSVGLSSTAENVYTAYREGPPQQGAWPDGSDAERARAERYRQVRMTEEEFQQNVREHCRVTFCETLSVGFDATGRRPQSGLVDLPGFGEVAIEQLRPEVPHGTARRPEPGDLPPAVVHVTHRKAGSQWISAILRACVPDRVVPPGALSGHFRYWSPEAGKVYPAVYLTREQFDTVPSSGDCRTFVVVRDLRDTVVSAYFSFSISHGMVDRTGVDLRRLLSSLTPEQGLLYLIDRWLNEPARIQLSWLEAGHRLIRYEDLLENDVEILEHVLLDDCELGVPRADFRRIVGSKRFAELASGRSRGTEDLSAHLRKGVAGDWRNHFSDRVTEAFKARYGGVLVATGYEKDLSW